MLLFSGFGATQKGYLLGAGIILRMSENGFGAIQKRVSSPVRSVSPLPAAIRIPPASLAMPFPLKPYTSHRTDIMQRELPPASLTIPHHC